MGKLNKGGNKYKLCKATEIDTPCPDRQTDALLRRKAVPRLTTLGVEDGPLMHSSNHRHERIHNIEVKGVTHYTSLNFRALFRLFRKEVLEEILLDSKPTLKTLLFE